MEKFNGTYQIDCLETSISNSSVIYKAFRLDCLLVLKFLSDLAQETFATSWTELRLDILHNA